jgi:hypothetical protein
LSQVLQVLFLLSFAYKLSVSSSPFKFLSGGSWTRSSSEVRIFTIYKDMKLIYEDDNRNFAFMK